MEGQKKGIHYAWWILISCCCFFAGSMALTQSIAGVYMLPVSTDIGVSRGDFGLWLTVNCIVTVITLPFWGRFIQTKNINVVLSIAAAVEALGILGFSFSTSLPMFLGFAVLTGLGNGAMFNLAGPTLIQNWFAEKHRGKMLGIAAAFTGVGTFIWAPLFTMFIQTMGWHTAYLINAIFAAVLMLPFSLFVVKFKPEDKGLKPFGYVEGDEQAGAAKIQDGVQAKNVFKYAAFYLVCLGLIFACLGMGYNSNQPGLAIEQLVPLDMIQQKTSQIYKDAAMIGATMISIAAVGNLLGKIVFGALADRAGLRITFIIFMIMYVLAYVVWLVFFGNVLMLEVGAFLLGTHNALISVAFPLLARKLFGNKDYAQIWSYCSMPFTLVSGFGTALVGYIYGAFGSYTVSLYIGIIFVVISAICALAACAFIGKIKWDGQKEAAAAA